MTTPDGYNEAEELELKLSMLVHEARPLIKDLNSLVKNMDEHERRLRKLADLLEIKSKEAYENYKLVKDIQDATDKRLSDLAEMLEHVKHNYQKLNRVIDMVPPEKATIQRIGERLNQHEH